MTQNLAWLGFMAAAAIGWWTMGEVGDGGLFVNGLGALHVLGGVLCAALVSYPVPYIRRAAASFLRLIVPRNQPAAEDVSPEILRLSGIARAQGGLLALQNEGREFAGGFLNRALLIAIAAGEERKVREILEADIRQTRIVEQENSNVFRSLGTLAPMFGLLGTLIGIIMVLRTMSDPTKIGPSMSLAITASLYGIAFANLFCIPVAGHIRARALEEARLKEAVMEGVIDLMKQESTYLLELKLGSYAPGAAKAELEPAAEGAP